MCLLIDSEATKKFLKDKKDFHIKIYKIVCKKDDKFYTPFRNIEIKLNEPLAAEGKIELVAYRYYGCVLNGGVIHAFTDLEGCKWFLKNTNLYYDAMPLKELFVLECTTLNHYTNICAVGPFDEESQPLSIAVKSLTPIRIVSDVELNP